MMQENLEKEVVWPPLDVASHEYSMIHEDGHRNWIPCGEGAVKRLQKDPMYEVRPRKPPEK